MTEQEWLAGTDPEPMLTFLRGRASDRKLRLFGWACLRCTWPLLDAEWKRMVNNPWWRRMRFSQVEIEWAKTRADLVRKGVELAEKVADGVADPAELEALFTSPEARSWDIHAANDAAADIDFPVVSDGRADDERVFNDGRCGSDLIAAGPFGRGHGARR